MPKNRMVPVFRDALTIAGLLVLILGALVLVTYLDATLSQNWQDGLCELRSRRC